jgi:hypothetical protein
MCSYLKRTDLLHDKNVGSVLEVCMDEDVEVGQLQEMMCHQDQGAGQTESDVCTEVQKDQLLEIDDHRAKEGSATKQINARGCHQSVDRVSLQLDSKPAVKVLEECVGDDVQVGQLQEMMCVKVVLRHFHQHCSEQPTVVLVFNGPGFKYA